VGNPMVTCPMTSRDPNGQVVTPMRVQYRENSWRCYLATIATIANYRAMHFSAKRGIAIACRLSVRLSVRL